MSEYAKLAGNLPKMEGFPSIDVLKVTAWANRLFKAYLFRSYKKGEHWLGCSACGHSATFPSRLTAGAEYEALTTPHNQHTRCPWCGRMAQIKETRYLQKRKLLKEYVPIMVLTEKGGSLYGRGYWARKDYQGALLAKPLFMGTYAYYWGKHNVSVAFIMDNGREVKTIAGPRYGPKNYLPKPHSTGSWCFSIPEPCYVYGAEELAKTHLRYIQSKKLMPVPGSMETYARLVDTLTLGTSYPVTTELLLKQGAEDLVWDMLHHIRKNATLINWAADSPRTVLRNVSYREFSTAMANGYYGVEILNIYIKFQKAGRPEKLEKIMRTFEAAQYGRPLCEFALKYGLSIEKANNYAQRQLSTQNILTGTYALQIWQDTIDMAASLGYNTADPAIFFPEQLVRTHDKYTAQLQEKKKLEDELKARQREKEAAARLEKWAKKYEVEAEGYRIILPRTEREITTEGATLRHCVGGYAVRHMAGRLTILFLRRAAEPEASLYTIEMQGNRLIQIHGYRNDLGREAPAKTMAWFIEPWLKWLAAGSPRDAQGRAKIKIHRKELSAAV